MIGMKRRTSSALAASPSLSPSLGWWYLQKSEPPFLSED